MRRKRIIARLCLFVLPPALAFTAHCKDSLPKYAFHLIYPSTLAPDINSAKSPYISGTAGRSAAWIDAIFQEIIRPKIPEDHETGRIWRILAWNCPPRAMAQEIIDAAASADPPDSDSSMSMASRFEYKIMMSRHLLNEPDDLHSRLVESLIKIAVENKNEWIRKTAFVALGYGAGRMSDIQRQAVKRASFNAYNTDPSRVVRSAVLRMLRHLPAADTAYFLGGALEKLGPDGNDDMLWERVYAAESLGLAAERLLSDNERFDIDRILFPLVKCAGFSTHTDIRAAAAEALARCAVNRNESFIDIFNHLMTDKDPTVREFALWGMARLRAARREYQELLDDLAASAPLMNTPRMISWATKIAQTASETGNGASLHEKRKELMRLLPPVEIFGSERKPVILIDISSLCVSASKPLHEIFDEPAVQSLVETLRLEGHTVLSTRLMLNDRTDAEMNPGADVCGPFTKTLPALLAEPLSALYNGNAVSIPSIDYSRGRRTRPRTYAPSSTGAVVVLGKAGDLNAIRRAMGAKTITLKTLPSDAPEAMPMLLRALDLISFPQKEYDALACALYLRRVLKAVLELPSCFSSESTPLRLESMKRLTALKADLEALVEPIILRFGIPEDTAPEDFYMNENMDKTAPLMLSHQTLGACRDVQNRLNSEEFGGIMRLIAEIDECLIQAGKEAQNMSLTRTSSELKAARAYTMWHFLLIRERERVDVEKRDAADNKKLPPNLAAQLRAQQRLSVIETSWSTLPEVTQRLVTEIMMEPYLKQGQGLTVGIYGPSAIGKSTSAKALTRALDERLKESGKRAMMLSMGTIFRALTLCAIGAMSSEGLEDLRLLLPYKEETAAAHKQHNSRLIADYVRNHFKYFPAADGTWHLCYVKKPSDTSPHLDFEDGIYAQMLRDAKRELGLEKHIPVVAEVAQDAVKRLVSSSLQDMNSHGLTVVLEGRWQTLFLLGDSIHKYFALRAPSFIRGQRRALEAFKAALNNQIYTSV